MPKFTLYRRNAGFTTLVADDMDAAIDRALEIVGTRSADIDCISDGITMITDEAGDGGIVEYALVEEHDWCSACGRDYDAMTVEERWRHVCDGEIVVLTCAGTPNAVTWS